MRLNLGLQTKLVRLRNELRAMKVASELAYSSVLMPDNSPSVSWSGDLSLTSGENTVARFRVRFTRTDEAEIAPFVDFAPDVAITPTYADYLATQEQTLTGNDIGGAEAETYRGYVVGAGENYVDYYLDFGRELVMMYTTLQSVAVAITVTGIAMCPGTMTITRLI